MVSSDLVRSLQFNVLNVPDPTRELSYHQQFLTSRTQTDRRSSFMLWTVFKVRVWRSCCQINNHIWQLWYSFSSITSLQIVWKTCQTRNNILITRICIWVMKENLIMIMWQVLLHPAWHPIQNEAKFTKKKKKKKPSILCCWDKLSTKYSKIIIKGISHWN